MMQIYPSLASHWLTLSHLIFGPHDRARRALAGVLLALLASLALGAGAVFANEKPEPAQVVKVNINTADAETLAAGLKGVGQSRAQEIVRYRQTFGPFTSADELAEVKGIGQATLDLNRKLITLE